MGRIKSKNVKKAAKQLVEAEGSFSTDFEKNKLLLKDTMPSKPIRNKVAGYISHIIKMKSSTKSRKVYQNTPINKGD